MLNFMSKVKKEFLLTDIDANTSPDYPTERTGRCHKCNIRFIWPNSFGRLKDMTCPICGTALAQTTHLFKGRTIKISPPAIVTVVDPETSQSYTYERKTVIKPAKE